MLHAYVNKIGLSVLLCGLAVTVLAHSYFFGVSDLTLNPKTKHIEVIHQFTAHDIENTIAEVKQISFSPEHPNYDNYIQDYFEQHFSLRQNNQKIQLNWIGFEMKRGQLFAYQESSHINFLVNLVVKNTILVDTYPKQINTVNYQDLSYAPTQKLQGSLTFDSTQRIAEINAPKAQ